MCNTTWVDVPFDNRYEVSNDGQVRRKSEVLIVNGQNVIIPSRLLQPHVNNGFVYVNFSGSSFAVHRLVADVFLTENQDLRFVHHIDGNKLNNSVSNLERISGSDQVSMIRKSPNYKESCRNSHRVMDMSTGQVYSSTRDAWRQLSAKIPSLSYDKLRRSILDDTSIDGVKLVRL